MGFYFTNLFKYNCFKSFVYIASHLSFLSAVGLCIISISKIFIRTDPKNRVSDPVGLCLNI